MRRCKRCVLPDTKPDLYFDEEGICSACRSYERRPTIDWNERKRALLNLLDRHYGRCIVPSSGGKDSHYQALTLLELGAKVTLVTATTCMLTEIGRKNIDNLGRYADTIEVTPKRTQRALLNRLGLEMVGDISWPEHAAIFSIPFQMACALNTPLIFYGENPQDQYGGPPGTDGALQMTRRWVSEFGGFLGLRPQDLVQQAGDMSAYMPPSEGEIAAKKIEAHFLGKYLPWNSRANAQKAVQAGMQYVHPALANWWSEENQDCKVTGIHDHMMFRKYGYGRGCAQISVDVRAGRVMRKHALNWVKEADGAFPYFYMGTNYLDVLRHIGMELEHFQKVLAQFTDWNLFSFEQSGNGKILIAKEEECSPAA